MNDGKFAQLPDYLPQPRINLLWHDLANIVQSNTIEALPDQKDWAYDLDKIRSTFDKNVTYILAHQDEWRIIVHVCACHRSNNNECTIHITRVGSVSPVVEPTETRAWTSSQLTSPRPWCLSSVLSSFVRGVLSIVGPSPCLRVLSVRIRGVTEDGDSLTWGDVVYRPVTRRLTGCELVGLE